MKHESCEQTRDGTSSSNVHQSSLGTTGRLAVFSLAAGPVKTKPRLARCGWRWQAAGDLSERPTVEVAVSAQALETPVAAPSHSAAPRPSFVTYRRATVRLQTWPGYVSWSTVRAYAQTTGTPSDWGYAVVLQLTRIVIGQHFIDYTY